MVETIEIEGVEFDINDIYEMANGLFESMDYYREKDLDNCYREAKRVREKLLTVIDRLENSTK